MNLKLIMTCMLLSLLTACASAPQIEIAPFDKSKTVEGSFDSVWSNLVRFLSTNDVSIATIEKDSGLIALKGENLSASLITQYCNATPGFLSSITSGLVTGSITVVDEGGFTTVNTNMRYRATQVSGMSNPPTYSTFDCVSKGVLETAILSSFN